MPIHIALLGLGYATYPECIRSKKRLGDKVGIFEIDNSLAKIEIISWFIIFFGKNNKF